MSSEEKQARSEAARLLGANSGGGRPRIPRTCLVCKRSFPSTRLYQAHLKKRGKRGDRKLVCVVS